MRALTITTKLAAEFFAGKATRIVTGYQTTHRGPLLLCRANYSHAYGTGNHRCYPCAAVTVTDCRPMREDEGQKDDPDSWRHKYVWELSDIRPSPAAVADIALEGDSLLWDVSPAKIEEMRRAVGAVHHDPAGHHDPSRAKPAAVPPPAAAQAAPAPPPASPAVPPGPVGMLDTAGRRAARRQRAAAQVDGGSNLFGG